jgi:hypothetical protein
MIRFGVTCGCMLLLAACTVLVSSEASAQKKKTPPKAEQAVEQSAPAPGKFGNTLKDVLAKFRGEKTNLGLLSKVEADYFIVEEDGVMTLHPIGAIVSIKILKPEEGEEEAAKVEIVLTR